MSDISTLDIIIRLIVTFILSAIIGFEREWYRKPAGLRTLVIVGLSSSLFTIVSFRLRDIFPGSLADPGRIAAQVITGIGFIGAGAIIRAKGSVIGLTTAASIFMVSAIGMACAFGLFTEAIIATILVIISFYGLSYVVKYERNKSPIHPPNKNLIDEEEDDGVVMH
ncbi:MAG: Mg2+ transporter-C, MgtC family [Parcubacteria group bacterium GW2011_GWC2_39_14]|nr:MAG: Mg2+ transporter-C, MgtC family [Parcubacteria group bacterium GW2011_GWC2_39_14]